MALKGDRYELDTDVSYFMNATATRGGVASLYTAGSGAALDQAAAEVRYIATPSGYRPMGILLNDVVNKDLTQTHLNQHKNEVQQGQKVTLLRRGWCVTNMIYPGVTPAAQDNCYVGLSGYLTNALVANDQSAAQTDVPIGEFMSTKDEDGYCKVQVNLPVTAKPAA